MYRIGIDVGGTNTDVVVMQNEKVLLGVKNPTTEDVMTGVINSLKEVIEKTEISKKDEISSVMIGTTTLQTQLLNAKDYPKLQQ